MELISDVGRRVNLLLESPLAVLLLAIFVIAVVSLLPFGTEQTLLDGH